MKASSSGIIHRGTKLIPDEIIIEALNVCGNNIDEAAEYVHLYFPYICRFLVRAIVAKFSKEQNLERIDAATSSGNTVTRRHPKTTSTMFSKGPSSMHEFYLKTTRDRIENAPIANNVAEQILKQLRATTSSGNTVTMRHSGTASNISSGSSSSLHGSNPHFNRGTHKTALRKFDRGNLISSAKSCITNVFRKSDLEFASNMSSGDIKFLRDNYPDLTYYTIKTALRNYKRQKLISTSESKPRITGDKLGRALSAAQPTRKRSTLADAVKSGKSTSSAKSCIVDFFQKSDLESASNMSPPDDIRFLRDKYPDLTYYTIKTALQNYKRQKLISYYAALRSKKKLPGDISRRGLSSAQPRKGSTLADAAESGNSTLSAKSYIMDFFEKSDLKSASNMSPPDDIRFLRDKYPDLNYYTIKTALQNYKRQKLSSYYEALRSKPKITGDELRKALSSVKPTRKSARPRSLPTPSTSSSRITTPQRSPRSPTR